jgi:hypothetical protein
MIRLGRMIQLKYAPPSWRLVSFKSFKLRVFIYKKSAAFMLRAIVSRAVLSRLYFYSVGLSSSSSLLLPPLLLWASLQV